MERGFGEIVGQALRLPLFRRQQRQAGRLPYKRRCRHIHLLPLASFHFDQVHGQRIEEFVGEYDTGDGIRNRVAGFNDPVIQVGRGCQYILAQLPTMAAELNDLEPGWMAEFFPPFQELPGQHLAEQRADADAGEIIARFADAFAARSVVPMLRVVKGQIHEPFEGDAAAAAVDVASDSLDEIGVAIHAREHSQTMG